MSPFLVLLVSAIVVVLAGIRLARDGDRIAERTGLGGAWVGAIMVAAATSLPELAVDAGAVLLGAPNLAVGDLVGSGMFSLLIHAILGFTAATAAILVAAPRLASSAAGIADRPGVSRGFIGVLLDLLDRSERRFWRVEPAPALVIAGYLLSLLAVHRATG